MNKLKISLEPINQTNVNIAGKIQHEIFPFSSSYIVYLEEIENKNSEYTDFIISLNDCPIGVIGYSLDDDKETIWLSWFGLLNPYRKQGFGKQALDILCDMLKAKNFKILRLFTYEVWNSEAQPFYNKYMDFGEYYTNKDDNQYDIEVGKCKIFTKSLLNEKVCLWNNKFINIGKEDDIHKKSLEKLKEHEII